MGKTQLFIVWLLDITWMENGENPVIYSMVVRYYTDGKWGKPSYL